MQPAQQQISTCPNCGGVIEETSGGEVGCMFCLLQAGIGSEKKWRKIQARTLSKAVCALVSEIDCHADGSLCELGRGAMGVTCAPPTRCSAKVALKLSGPSPPRGAGARTFSARSAAARRCTRILLRYSIRHSRGNRAVLLCDGTDRGQDAKNAFAARANRCPHYHRHCSAGRRCISGG